MAVLKHSPTHDWIIGKKLHAPDDDAPLIHGIHRIGHKPPHHYAIVIAVGPGREHPQTGHRPALPCAVGDTIMVRAVAGDPENIEDVEYFWFMPDEVLAIIKKEDLLA